MHGSNLPRPGFESLGKKNRNTGGLKVEAPSTAGATRARPTKEYGRDVAESDSECDSVDNPHVFSDSDSERNICKIP